jgi:hypothetical protein
MPVMADLGGVVARLAQSYPHGDEGRTNQRRTNQIWPAGGFTAQYLLAFSRLQMHNCISRNDEKVSTSIRANSIMLDPAIHPNKSFALILFQIAS